MQLANCSASLCRHYKSTSHNRPLGRGKARYRSASRASTARGVTHVDDRNGFHLRDGQKEISVYATRGLDEKFAYSRRTRGRFAPKAAVDSMQCLKSVSGRVPPIAALRGSRCACELHQAVRRPCFSSVIYERRPVRTKRRRLGISGRRSFSWVMRLWR